MNRSKKQSKPNADEAKLIASFEQKLQEKELKKQEQIQAQKNRELERERKKREFDRFQQEINEMLNDDEEEEVKPAKSYVPIAISSVKGRWDEVEKQHQQSQLQRAKTERRAREAKDEKDRKKIAKDLLQKELEDIENSSAESTRRKRTTNESKPKKLNITVEDLEKQREEERLAKLAEERKRRIEEDKERMEFERSKYTEELDDEVVTEARKETISVKKLNISIEDLERERLERERQKTEEERRKREEMDALIIKSEREKYVHDADNEPEVQKTTITVGKISVNFDEIVAMKSEKDKNALAEGMKDKMQHFRQLRQQSLKYQEEDLRMREQDHLGSLKKEKTDAINPNKLDKDKMNMDQAFREREESLSKKIADEKLLKLEQEIRLMNEAKARQMEDELRNLVQEKMVDEERQKQVNRLGSKFTEFDKLADQKVAEEAEALREGRMMKLREEMALFEAQRAEMEEEFEVSNRNLTRENINVGKLDKSKTSFDMVEREREEERARSLKLKRMELLKSEIRQMEAEKQDWEDERENEQHNIQRIVPNKLNFNFEKAQMQRQLEEEKRIKEQKMKVMESELEELQNAWNEEDSEDEEEFHPAPSNRIVMDPGKLNKQQLCFDKEHLYNANVTENRPRKKINKMNTNNIFERMQKEKQAEEERRLEEQRYF